MSPSLISLRQRPLPPWARHAGACAIALLLAACGGGSDMPSADSEGTAAPDADGTRVQALASTSRAEFARATAVQRWSNPATWGGTLPPAGASIVIPAGKQVMLDVATPPLRTLTIEGSLVADPSRDVAITADGVMVRGGRLAIGTAGAPHLRRATITLTGASVSDLPGFNGFGAKVLAQMGGTLELHGRPVARSWTQLDGGDVAAGARQIRLAQAPGWLAGDRIVIASSSFNQAEHDVAEIERIDGALVTLKAGLRFAHHGAVRRVGDRSIDTRAAVGLLSRNIVVQGDSPSAGLRIGGHAMFMASAAMPAAVRISGVEFAGMGQLNQVGRYPLHFHIMANHCQGCYVRDTSVRDTLQRGIVLHDTSGVTVANNVVFNTVGHNIFVETEVTRGNVIDGNLALVNRQPNPAHTNPELKSQNDRLPANFWFKTGANQVTGNVAAGSQASGFNYDFINGDPIDFRRNTAYAAMGESRLGEGDFDIFGGLLIHSDAVRPATDRIEDVLVFHNSVGLWPEEVGTTLIRRFVAADNGINMVGRGVGNRMHFKDGLVVGTLPGSTRRPGMALHYTYGSDTVLENITFARYASINMSGGETDPTQSSVLLRNIRFIGPRPALDFGDLLRYEMADDTVLPRGAYVTYLAPWMVLGGECKTSVINPVDPDVYTFIHCPRSYALTELDVRSGGRNGYTTRINPFLVRNDGLRYRRAGGDVGMGSGTHGTTVLPMSEVSYRIDQAAATTPMALRLIDDGNENVDNPVVPETTRLNVAVPLAAAPRAVHRTGSHFHRPNAPTATSALRPAASLADFETNPLTTYLYDPASRQLWVQTSRRWVIIQP